MKTGSKKKRKEKKKLYKKTIEETHIKQIRNHEKMT